MRAYANLRSDKRAFFGGVAGVIVENGGKQINHKQARNNGLTFQCGFQRQTSNQRFAVGMIFI